MALYVVTGPPAAGKSTWVRAHAKHGDVVIDYDQLAAALTVPHTDSRNHGEALRAVISRARSAATTEALKHSTDIDVYVIHSLPSPEALSRYTEHDATIITIDPGRDVVMARIAQQYPPSMRAVAQRWYNASNHTAQPAQRASRHW